jgi:hypothetical protein
MEFKSPHSPNCRKRLSEKIRRGLKLESPELANEAKRLNFTGLSYPSRTGLICYIHSSEATIT